MMKHDVFISHASEDKLTIARPLADALKQRGISVWYDEFTLKLGDSLRRSIDRGLATSTFGVIVLSQSFFDKNWPQYELDALVQKENSSGQKVILPIWHHVNRDDVATFSPTLADRVAASSTSDIDGIAEQIVDVVRTSDKALTAPVAQSTSSDLVSQHRQGLLASYPGDRATAARELGRLGIAAADAVPTLIKKLKDSSGPVRDAAAWALREIGTESALTALERYEA